MRLGFANICSAGAHRARQVRPVAPGICSAAGGAAAPRVRGRCTCALPPACAPAIRGVSCAGGHAAWLCGVIPARYLMLGPHCHGSFGHIALCLHSVLIGHWSVGFQHHTCRRCHSLTWSGCLSSCADYSTAARCAHTRWPSRSHRPAGRARAARGDCAPDCGPCSAHAQAVHLERGH
jgi:hypothetical protein